MVSPHLLKVVESFSTSHLAYKDDETLKSVPEYLLGWEDLPVIIVGESPTKKKKPTWCHMVWARGPSLDGKSEHSELVIIWWSEMTPDTSRVLGVVDWEKHAKNVQPTSY